MKAKITRGKTFKGLLNYTFDRGKKATGDKAPIIVGGNMAGTSPQQLTREFVAVRQLRPDIERAVWHCSLSLPPGEHPTDKQWDEITQDFMQGMGFSDYTPYVAVRHNDKGHDHVHIVASRIGGDSKVWTGEWEVYKAIEVTQQLEEKYNLTRVAFKPAEKKRPTYKEVHKAERTGIRPPRERLQELIDEALAEPSDSYIADRPTAPQLAKRLEEKGVIVRANVASTGRMNGFSFELDGLAFKGSSLGKAYSWSGLQKRGVSYDVERDAAQLERYKLPVAERPPRTDETVPETSRSTKTVKTSPLTGNEPNIATAKTEETSPLTGAEKMLKALEGYYQSQIDKNEETVETSPPEDLVDFSQSITTPTDTDTDSTDTDTTEAARLESALNAIEEIFNDAVAQGEARAIAKFNASKTPQKAQPTSTSKEVDPEITTPEATQAPVEQNALSETLPNEADPEITQTSIEQNALSEAQKEQNQQHQWVESLAPKLAYLLANENVHEVEGKHHTITWDSDRQRLSLRKNETQDIVLDAEWGEERWQDNGSNLTAVEFEQLKLALDRYIRERERERKQQQRYPKGLER